MSDEAGTYALKLALIGFGEAGQAFASGWPVPPSAYDIKTDAADTRPAKLADYERCGVSGRGTLAEALAGAGIIVSLVTADQALAAAEAAASLISVGAFYCDFNSVAPQTKRAAERMIVAGGGHYVDVAVMAPVHPGRLETPLLVSGPEAIRAAALLRALGFATVRVVGLEIGQASSIKMIRSVMVKGIEALTAECVLAAEAAGVREEVLRSLTASEKPADWAARADYNLDRMMVHGLRRAAEMDEVVKTLDGLGTGSTMTRGTVERQRAIGALGLSSPADTLDAKIAQINERIAGA